MARPNRTHKKKNQLSAETGNEDKKVESKENNTLTSTASSDNTVTSNEGKVINIEELKAELTTLIRKQVEHEFKRAEHIKEKTTHVTSKLELVNEKTFSFSGTADGLNISELDSKSKNQRLLISSGANGAIGVGASTPKTVGTGTLHIKSSASEGNIPSHGKHATRGLLLESPGFDSEEFIFRAVSKGNKQGLNITGDGKLMFGLIEDTTASKISILQNNHTGNTFTGYTASRYFNSTMLKLETAAPSNNTYTFLEAKNQSPNFNSGIAQSVFKVTGAGSVYADESLFSNRTGYAEMFEWADNNNRNEDRCGFTVTLDKTGKICVADEGDKILGVVVTNAAFVGNVGWNHWCRKYEKDPYGTPKKFNYQVIEWEDQTGELYSHFNSTLPQNFQLPKDAITYETDEYGNNLKINQHNVKFDYDKEYTPRQERPEWAMIAITGTVTLYKGQITNPNWIKIKDVNDELELWVLK